MGAEMAEGADIADPAPGGPKGGGRRAVLVVNSRSRQGDRLYSESRALLLKKGFELAASHPVRDPSRIPEIIKEAVEGGERLIAVGGGDGTISSIVDFLAYKDVALGILPMGTANNFARGLGLPLELADAIEVIANGQPASIDLGKIGNNYFSNAVSLGLSATLHRASRDGIKRYFGRAGYLLSAVRSFAAHRPFRCRLEHDGATSELEALDMRIANGPFHGGMVAVPGADVESRDLVVRAIKGNSKWTLPRVWADIARGRPLDAAAVEIIRVRQLTVTAEPVQAVSVDGEVIAETPVTISVAAGALRVMVQQNPSN
jgi:YegS/Rv2252/BmrU family lipid kinase